MAEEPSIFGNSGSGGASVADPFAGLVPNLAPTPSVTIPIATSSVQVVATIERAPRCPVPESALGSDGRAMVDGQLAQFDVAQLTSAVAMSIGQELYRSLYGEQQQLLRLISKAKSPLLYELVGELEKGMKEVDFDAIGRKVDKSQQSPGLIVRGWRKLRGITDAESLKRSAEDLKAMLDPAGAKLSSLVERVKERSQGEVETCIEALRIMKEQADTYVATVGPFAIATVFTYELLAKAVEHYDRLEASLNPGDVVQVDHLRAYGEAVEALRTRAVTLATSYAKAAVVLERIAVIRGAGTTHLATVANSFWGIFTDLQTELLTFYATSTIQQGQAGQRRLRAFRDGLQIRGDAMLRGVSTEAAAASGRNAIEDAKHLLERTNDLKKLGGEIKAAKAQSLTDFSEAEKTLLDVLEKTTRIG